MRSRSFLDRANTRTQTRGLNDTRVESSSSMESEELEDAKDGKSDETLQAGDTLLWSRRRASLEDEEPGTPKEGLRRIEVGQGHVGFESDDSCDSKRGWRLQVSEIPESSIGIIMRFNDGDSASSSLTSFLSIGVIGGRSKMDLMAFTC
jgi:hypothetical protein